MIGWESLSPEDITAIQAMIAERQRKNEARKRETMTVEGKTCPTSTDGFLDWWHQHFGLEGLINSVKDGRHWANEGYKRGYTNGYKKGLTDYTESFGRPQEPLDSMPPEKGCMAFASGIEGSVISAELKADLVKARDTILTDRQHASEDSDRLRKEHRGTILSYETTIQDTKTALDTAVDEGEETKHELVKANAMISSLDGLLAERIDTIRIANETIELRQEKIDELRSNLTAAKEVATKSSGNAQENWDKYLTSNRSATELAHAARELRRVLIHHLIGNDVDPDEWRSWGRTYDDEWQLCRRTIRLTDAERAT